VRDAYAQVSQRPLAGSCMKQVGQIAGGASVRLRGAGVARGRRTAVDLVRVADGGASARTRAVSSASPMSARTIGSHSTAGIRVNTPDRCCT
jgi:hypothetical protein